MENIPTYPNYTDVTKMVYTMPEIKQLLGLSRGQAYNLMQSNQFPILRAVRKKLVPIKPFHKWVTANYPNVNLPEYYEVPSILKSNKKSYSVPEVRAMLGMKKTSSYEMIKVGTFKTVIVNEHIRILKDSFDEWFHSQDHLFENKQEVK